MNDTSHRRWMSTVAAAPSVAAPLVAALAGAAVAWAGCGPPPASGRAGVDLDLPPGFRVTAFADSLGWARHVAASPAGDVYVAVRRASGAEWTSAWRSGPDTPGGIVALRDGDGDGRADRVERIGADRFGEAGGTGIAVRDGRLWFATDTSVHRWRLETGRLLPAGPPETVVSGFPAQAFHGAKSLAFDDRGGLYVNVGAPSNACQEEDREPGSPGRDPCPELALQAGIWRFDAEGTGQRHGRDGRRVATGVRNALALAWSPAHGALYAVLHGRDQLDAVWPERFTAAENARLPAEEMHRIGSGADAGVDLGWPYCYRDPRRGAHRLNPEYGGDGVRVGRCAGLPEPAVEFPAHWAPNDLLFHSGRGWPARYAGGALVAFHGSWNRAGLQEGYRVTFVRAGEDGPGPEWEPFATGFEGPRPVESRADARHRPTGLAEGPDGALYVSDSVLGRVWRITYMGTEEGGAP